VGTFWVASIVLGGLILGGSARADWADDFDAGFAEAWIFGAVDDVGDPPATGVSTFSIIEAGADDYLRISHSTVAFRDGGGGATDGFGYVDEVFGDMAVSADINAAPLDGQQNLIGVVGRANPVNGTTYAAGVDFANSFFAIGRSNDFENFFNPLATDTSVVIDPNETYRVQFFLLGSNLTARLIALSTGQIVSTLTTVDSLYSTGVAGILVETEYNIDGFPLGPIVGTFDNVRGLPEPSLVSLIGCGAGMLALLGGNARRRAGRKVECGTASRAGIAGGA
jgi:hypothetical protein